MVGMDASVRQSLWVIRSWLGWLGRQDKHPAYDDLTLEGSNIRRRSGSNYQDAVG